MNIKSLMKNENGSMAVYVLIVLLSMLIILTAVFFLSNFERRQQMLTAVMLKDAYEVDVDNIAEIYNYLVSK